MNRLFDAIVLDSERDTRARLRGAAKSSNLFHNVREFGRQDDTITQLKAEENVDIVFISYQFSLEEIEEFINEAKKTEQGSTCAFILLLSAANQSSTILADGAMCGADGFLLEPYSVDAIAQQAELAAKLIKERIDAKKIMLRKFLIEDALRQLNEIARLDGYGRDATPAFQEFRKIATKLQSLAEEDMDQHFQTLIEIFCDAPKPVEVPKRIKERRKKLSLNERLLKRTELREKSAE